MSFFDTIRQQASGVANNAVKQTKAVASVGRIKLAVASEEDKMKKAYTELGRLFFRDYEAQTEIVMDDYQIWCDKISDAKEQIARLNEEMEKIRAGIEPEVPAVETEEAPVILEEETLVSEVEEAAEAPEETIEEVDVTDAVAEASDAVEKAAEKIYEDVPVVDTLYVDESDSEE